MNSPDPTDVHDGHGNYLSELEAELRWISIRRFTDFMLGILAGWTVAYWIYLVTWPVHPGTADKVFGGIGLGIVGFIGLLMFTSFMGDLALARRYKRMLAVSCVVAFVFGGIWPMRHFSGVHAAAAQARQQLQVDFDQRLALARRKWLEDVYAASAHGPLGTEPPMIEVEDSGTRVLVRNISDRAIRCVNVIRRLEGGGSGYRMRAGHSDCRPLAPGDSSVYELRGSDPAYANGLLEFRIGDQHDPDPSWWSDSALQDSFRNELPVERPDLR